MTRYFSAEPSLALHNPLAGDRQFDGLRATDGTDISTRDKHRRYMKKHGLTLHNDFSPDHFAKKSAERQARLEGRAPEQRAARIGNLRDSFEMVRDKSRYSKY